MFQKLNCFLSSVGLQINHSQIDLSIEEVRHQFDGLLDGDFSFGNFADLSQSLSTRPVRHKRSRVNLQALFKKTQRPRKILRVHPPHTEVQPSVKIERVNFETLFQK